MSEFELADNLSRGLSRVEAPPELWARIQTSPQPRRTGSPLLAAAAVFVVSLASASWYVSRQSASPVVKPVISRSGSCATCHLS